MQVDLPKLEEKILKFWKDKKIFEKSLKRTEKGPNFIFFEGPPFANGLPGIHHLLARAFKDIILRYKTMQGFYVKRRAGWDTHGLPTEMAAEKKLNIKTKKEIEKAGINKFIKECQNNVFTYKKEWEEFTQRIGFWLDFDKAYITCSNDYIESLWWILKQIWEKGLLYQDYKVVPYCPRCGTSLSFHEVAQGYKLIKDNSVYVKLKLKDEKNTYLLVWTTTPWTLPGNTAVAVNPKIDYVKVKIKSENLILAKQRLSVLDGKYEIVEKIKGKELIDKEYQPLFDFIKTDKKSYYVVSGDFVSLNEGTGLVHMAPAFGEDDMKAAKENDLPVLMTIKEDGKFKKEIKDWAGLSVVDEKTNNLIIENLAKRKLLYKEEIYEHEYPFCWRCKEKLIYYAKDSWFIKMSKVRKELNKNNEKINWVPKYIKKGRFGEWIDDIKDWNLSRERFWGTPLPVWQCDQCDNIKVIGSIKELEKLTSKKVKDIHRPFIDNFYFKCDKCKGEMKRVEEVIDCWFDSGSMPFAQWHYPFENKDKIDKGEFFPADYITEGIDQTRGWFYTLLAVSTLLDRGNPYKNVISLGLVLDSKGQKMSKSKGNIVVPKQVIDKFGADCSRLYFYTVNQVGESKRFDFKEIEDLYRKFFDTLWQSYNFFALYKEKNFKPKQRFEPKQVLDKWIISRLENLNAQAINYLDNFDVISSARLFENFADDLSNWYIRRSRQRFQRPETKQEKDQASQTLYYLISKLSKLIAPFTPFFAEELYQSLNSNKNISVHLCDYPDPKEKLINKDLEEKMEKVREIVAKALAERAKLKIKVRQPLNKLEIKSKKIEKELIDLIKQEVNVDNIVFNSKIEKEIKLDTRITKELEQRGMRREEIHGFKQLRKELKLTKYVIVKSACSTTSTKVVSIILPEIGAKKYKKTKDKNEMEKYKLDAIKEIELEKGKKDYIGIKI